MKKAEILERIESGHRAVKRGGDFLQTIFNKTTRVLTGDEALRLFNTYGIRIEELVKLIYSHRFTFDEQEFARLLAEQSEKPSILASE